MASNEDSFNCVFCKEPFDSKEELQVHFRKHGDPKFNHNMKNRVSNDSDACGDKSSDIDMVSCDVCSDTFPSISKAITHKHKVHPDHDAKYFCPWCGKLFTMKHLYNKHVETSHSSKMQYEGDGFHCDYCEADFFVPSAMLYHNKFFHRQDTELAAIGQSRKQMLFNQETLPLYYCPFCGEEYFNKVNLHKHMGDDHSDENQSPDDVLRCPLCEAIFYHLDAYELHLTFHSADDTYSEENEICKSITEFSLEAVPPIMEKVENETTADSETTINSIGIGDFLQLGMDEFGEKKKKKKKHKKSKKSAITLDEFLNMNKDVFGEGIDVEGIEEVPTRVVAKRLNTHSQKPKPPAHVSSAELQKLKKQGIVVKKKSGNVLKSSSFKTMKGIPSGKPLNIAQKLLAKKVTTDTSNSTKDVLSKLLSQSNSQLKIVKKPLHQVLDSDSKELPSTFIDHVHEKESNPKIKEYDLSKHENEKLANGESGKIKITSDNTNETYQGSNLNWDSPNTEEASNKLEQNEDGDKNKVQTKHETIIEHVDKVNKHPQEDISCKSETVNNTIKTLTSLSNSIGVKEHSENVTCEFDKDVSHKISSVNQRLENIMETKKEPLDTLKNLSHLTVKPMNQPKVSTLHLTNTDYQGCEVEDTDETGKKDDKNLVALKLLNKSITVTTSNQPVNKYCDIDKDEDKTVKLQTGDSANKQAQSKKTKDDTNLDTLKLLTKSITIKSSNQTVQANKYLHNDIDKDEDETEKLKTEAGSWKEQANSTNSNNNKNLEALKLLSKNITIKSSNQTMQPNKQLHNDIVDEEDNSAKLKTDDPVIIQKPLQQSKDDRNLEALKLLSKSITIKSPNQPVQANKYLSSDVDKESYVSQEYDKTVNKNLIINTLDTKSQASIKSVVKSSSVADNQVNIKIPTGHNPPKINKPFSAKEIHNCNESFYLEEEQQPVKIQHCDKFLKQLGNITAKPLSQTRQQITTAVSKSSNVIYSKEGTIVKTAIKMAAAKEIETFNIDDSDEEDEVKEASGTLNNTSMKISKMSSQIKNSHHTEKIKSLGQLNTIKRTSQQNPVQNSSHHDRYKNSYVDDYDDVCKESNPYMTISVDHKNSVQNKLKNLSKHITIKPRNTSTNITPERMKFNQNIEHDSDTQIGTAKVKISELPDNFSDDDEFDEIKESPSLNVIVESPHDCSENDEFDSNDEDDIETQVKSNILQKPNHTHTQSYSEKIPVNNLQNISKDITIKSLGVKENFDSHNEYEPPREMNSKTTNLNKRLSLKQANISSRHVDTAVTQIAKASDREHNTENTEVIVKKFGTKTVIEEITTTVTKTIRTVNQTFQQENTNSGQIITPSTSSQKIQNMISRQPQTRPATPSIGTKVRNATPLVRTSIRPANQLVSVRPGLNIRPNIPKISVAQKQTCTATLKAKQPSIGKPLKISPNAFLPSNKRPTSEDSNGPFSCFKKQKESLIPMGDLPETSQGDTSVLYASSHISKSHVSNTTKIIAGNSMMTSSQVKSEASASSEQFSRLSNMSGLKVVKTSSAKQVSKVEECEMNTSNRGTLEAIERLKKQGLLIKKPRIDDNFSEHFNSDDNFE